MMKRGAIPLVGLAAPLILGAPAWGQPAAQSGEAAESGNIVVTGRAPTRSEVSRQARDITDMSSAIRDEPLPRFEDRLCPGVLGLRTEAAALMIDRIRDTARRLDLRLAEDDGTCSPNLIVAFVEDGQADIRRIAENNGWAFEGMSLARRRSLLEEEGPVRVWTTTQLRTRDGIPVPRSLNLNDPPVVNTWMAHSKIYTAVREDITRVVVLIDKEGARGKTLLQLADYATMRGLARTRPVDGDGRAMDTILALFDPDGNPPQALTDFDEAYLAAVYDGLPNMPGITKVLGVNRQLRRQADKPRETAAPLE